MICVWFLIRISIVHGGYEPTFYRGTQQQIQRSNLFPSESRCWANQHRNMFTSLQGGAPQLCLLIIIPLTIDISPTKTIVIGVMFTNLAIERGHHLVYLE